MMLILVFSISSLSACDNRQKTVELISVVSGNSYSLGIKPSSTYSGGDFCTFTVDLSITEIKEKLTKRNELCELFNDNFLLITKNLSEARKDYLIIGKLHNDRDYQFMSAVAYDIETGSYVLFPIHLLSITANSFSAGETYSFETNISYDLSGTMESVKIFYESSGLFFVEENESQINIRLLPNKFVHKHITDDFSVMFEKNSQKLSIKIQTEKQ
jgi:hypothetical protein